MGAYKSLVLKDINGSSEIVFENTSSLPAGEVLINVKYSTVNSYDILYMFSNGLISQDKFPYTPGIDAAGIVVESTSSTYREGDEVIVLGSGLGINMAGGYGQYIRVPETSVISLPTGISLKDSMTIGTDGIAAALAVMEIMTAGLDNSSKNVVVSNPSNNVGLFAASILQKCGYDVTAVVLDYQHNDFLKDLGINKIKGIEQFVDKSGSSLLEPVYAAGIDTIGVDVLSTMMRSVMPGSTIAVCGSIYSPDYSSSVYPLILRGVNLVGIEPVFCTKSLKREVLYKLAGDWYIKSLPVFCNEISLVDLSDYLKTAKTNSIKGRVVINHDL